MSDLGHGDALEQMPYFTGFVEGRRGEILDAALTVFGESGYEAGTMREIAKRVGVSEPALYRHYDSKEAILAEIVELAGDRIARQLTTIIDSFSADQVASQLRALIETRGELSFDLEAGQANLGAGGVLHILFHAAPHNDNFIGLLRSHLAEPLVRSVRAAIPRVDVGFGLSRPAEDTDARVRVFMSLFVGYFSTSIIFDAPAEDEAIVTALLGMMGWGDR